MNEIPSTETINKGTKIESLIPHKGLMCLWDEVTKYRENSITCITQKHQLNSNALTQDDTLSRMHLIEFGAQLAAIHGGITSRNENNTNAKNGYIASLREINFSDQLVMNVVIEAKQLQGSATILMTDEMSSFFEFELLIQKQKLCSGKIMVVHP